MSSAYSQKARVEAGTHTSPGQQRGSCGAPHCAPTLPHAPPVLTVNVPELVAVPPVVVIAIFPVTAPPGTVALTCVAELTTKLAVTSPNVTFVVCFKPLPAMTTC
ncbi:MAG TPA: hypothetical protein VGV15_18685, partial [Terriglobales bacterium]|nr:hypothetical protein [Terriglobales bacterium]